MAMKDDEGLSRRVDSKISDLNTVEHDAEWIKLTE